ncbi:MAG: ATP-binding protein [Bryobacteraceae bacterium]
MHVLDVVENSISAGARRVAIRVRESRSEDSFLIEIADDGAGMSEETLRRATDPFFTTRTTRRVGLGLPLLEQAAQAAGGWLRIESAPGVGTKVTALFRHGHIDRQPLGDMGRTLLSLIVGNPDVEFDYRREAEGREVSLNSREFADQLEGLPIVSPRGISALKKRIKKLDELLAG